MNCICYTVYQTAVGNVIGALQVTKSSRLCAKDGADILIVPRMTESDPKRKCLAISHGLDLECKPFVCFGNERRARIWGNRK